jgi:hypothetical protein
MWINERLTEFVRQVQSREEDWLEGASRLFDRISHRDHIYIEYALNAYTLGPSSSHKTSSDQLKKRQKTSGEVTMSEVAPKGSTGQQICIMHLSKKGCRENDKGSKTCGFGNFKRIHESPQSMPRSVHEMVKAKYGGWAGSYNPSVSA